MTTFTVDITKDQWESMMSSSEDQARLREQIEGSIEQMGVAIRAMTRTKDLMVRLLEQGKPADPEVMFVYQRGAEEQDGS